MALPTITKTWQFNVNQALANSGNATTNMQNALFALKQSLIGFGSSPWVVVSSSNGSSSGAADYWTSGASIVFGNGVQPRSWIILQQAGVSGGGSTQLLIDCLGTIELWFVLSPSGGFTGGTTTTSPTRPADILVVGNTAMGAWHPGAQNVVLHVMMTSTGSSTRWFLMYAGSNYLFSLIETLESSEVAYKGVVFGVSNGVTYNNFYGGANWGCRVGATLAGAYTATEAYAGVLVIHANSGAASNISGAYPMTAMNLYSETVGSKGYIGRIPDLWFGPNALATGSTFPATPDSKTHVKIGPVVVPWNGTTPVMT